MSVIWLLLRPNVVSEVSAESGAMSELPSAEYDLLYTNPPFGRTAGVITRVISGVQAN
eukprot:SAG22_NODE_115_length_19315_cov_10.458368_14_plen_58_part_00